ncbi:MAG TPA: phytanoyl-CoA dioxygenase family protein [Humisphaera sp.]|nr:phytanoyl-CoA dioxygenase family protein [Humisphaera sp.]
MQDILRDGYAIAADVVTRPNISGLLDALESASATDAGGKPGGMHALRNILQLPAIRSLAHSPELRRLVEPILGPGSQPVRAIFFDKTPDANWKVTWHQDISIAAKCRMDVEGFGPWSVKAGVPHVQPPASVLANMLTLRLHLDDCNEDNGPLRVIPGSHAAGILSSDMIADFRRRVSAVSCICRAGDVMLMRPLLLHASSVATSPRHRRVVHIEYAVGDLPAVLEWHEWTPSSTLTGNIHQRGMS